MELAVNGGDPSEGVDSVPEHAGPASSPPDLDPTPEQTSAPIPSPSDPPAEDPEIANDATDSVTVHSTDNARRRRPETLVELYTMPKAAAPELLALLAKQDKWNTPAGDREAALKLLDDRDRDLGKTRTLAQHVATTHEGRFAGSFESFLLRAVESELDDTPGWPPEQGAHGPDTFAQMLAHHEATLIENEPPRRLFNAVMIAQSVLMARYRLDVQDAVPALARALGAPRALRSDRRNPRLTRLRALGDTRLTVENLRTWLDVLAPWIERSIEAEKRAERADTEAANHHARASRLTQELARAEHQYDTAREEIFRLRQELQAKTDRERGVSLARQHEDSQLRGSLAGFLEDELSASLASVREGLELDPPRVPYSLERLDDAEHAIKGKVRWLRSSG